MNSTAEQLKMWLEQRQAINSHRQLLLISAEENEAMLLAQASLPYFERILWFGNAPQSVASQTITQYKLYLGLNTNLIIYNAYSGFKPSAIHALEGTLRHQGLLIILCPPLNKWPSYEATKRGISFSYQDKHTDSHYLIDMVKRFRTHQAVAIIQTDNSHLPLIEAPKHDLPFSPETHLVASTSIMTRKTCLIDVIEHSIGTGQLNQEQSNIFNIAQSHISKNTKKPIIVTGKRGRGKSTCLAAIAFNALAAGLHVVVSAPHKRNCEAILRAAGQNVYIPPDQLLMHPLSRKTLLLIDEAAAIAPDIIAKCVERYPHTIIATTTMGYEGSGLGFSIKLLPRLRTKFPDLVQCSLTIPIRWYEGDKLESLFIETFAPSSSEYTRSIDTRDEPRGALQNNQLRFESINKCDYAGIRDAYSLLAQAHYQTAPDDLMRYMDSDDHCLYVLKTDSNEILGALCIISEGLNIDNTLATEVSRKQRRLAGNLVNQALSVQTCNKKLLSLSNWRIARIAVSDKYRRRGLGKLMLNHIQQLASRYNVDMISSSFGLDTPLLHFWRQADFDLVKLGFRKDTSSGLQSAIMLTLLSRNAKKHEQSLRQSYVIEARYLSYRQVYPAFLSADITKNEYDSDEALLKHCFAVLQSIVSTGTSLKGVMSVVFVYAQLRRSTHILGLVDALLQKNLSKTDKQTKYQTLNRTLADDLLLYDHCT